MPRRAAVPPVEATLPPSPKRSLAAPGPCRAGSSHPSLGCTSEREDAEAAGCPREGTSRLAVPVGSEDGLANGSAAGHSGADEEDSLERSRDRRATAAFAPSRRLPGSAQPAAMPAALPRRVALRSLCQALRRREDEAKRRDLVGIVVLARWDAGGGVPIMPVLHDRIASFLRAPLEGQAGQEVVAAQRNRRGIKTRHGELDEEEDDDLYRPSFTSETDAEYAF